MYTGNTFAKRHYSVSILLVQGNDSGCAAKRRRFAPSNSTTDSLYSPLHMKCVIV
jgi:hypothetical protein